MQFGYKKFWFCVDEFGPISKNWNSLNFIFIYEFFMKSKSFKNGRVDLSFIKKRRLWRWAPAVVQFAKKGAEETVLENFDPFRSISLYIYNKSQCVIIIDYDIKIDYNYRYNWTGNAWHTKGLDTVIYNTTDVLMAIIFDETFVEQEKMQIEA